MATVAASHYIPINAQTTCDSEAKIFIRNGMNNLRNQTVSYHGLRSLNNVDLLTLRAAAKQSTKQQKGKGLKQEKAQRCGLVVVCSGGMNILFAGAECSPWCKTGGLGDVLSGLPPALAARGNRVMTVVPRYDQYKDAWDTGVLVELQVGDRTETVRFFHCHKRGVDRVFVDHPIFTWVWGKTGGKLYGPITGEDYSDNLLREHDNVLSSDFAGLQAALEAPRVLNLDSNPYFSGPYGEDVVFVANDWHTALLPCFLKSMYQTHGIYKNAKVAFCIHNIAYQGRFAFSDFALLNLPDTFKSSFDFIDGYDKPVKGRKINLMKAGMLQCDRLVTVSPNYALEILSDIARGVELHTIARLKTVCGIANGMDVQEWNPLTDKYIAVNYDETTVLDAKPVLKQALQCELGLPQLPDVPLIGFIGRLEEQKGSDILATAIPELMKENVQIVVLGTGKKRLEKQLEELETLYPDKARGVAKFNVSLAHMITTGADFMLVPSRFEPCGLIQLHAMRCGTLPICASTGGLVDTVKDGYTGFHMGAFGVDCDIVDPADVAAIVTGVKRALAVYGTAAYAEMVKNCMSQELSWKGPAKKWEQLLLSLEVAGSTPGIEDADEIAPLAKENVATP